MTSVDLKLGDCQVCEKVSVLCFHCNMKKYKVSPVPEKALCVSS